MRMKKIVTALVGLLLVCVTNVYAGTAYTNGRAFLRKGSPTGGGKVYVASNATEPAASAYKAVTSSTSPAFNVQVAGNATFHYWAKANTGYIFTGWYDENGTLVSSGAAHISKAVTAGTAGTSDTHAYADYYASFIKQIQLSFVVPTNGSFTIKHCGSEVTPAYSSFTTEGKVVLTALPADGYKLRGWYTTTNGGVTKNYFAFGNSCEPNFTANTTIGAEFVPDDGKATFWIKGTNQIYDNLTSANTAAASSSSKLIVVVSDGVVGAGTYTISSGVTLLIPYEETYNLMTTPNIKHIPTPNAASKVTSIFRKLTLASGATINVSGNICIGGSIASCNGGSPSSFPTGSVGMLDLSRGGTINLASGSDLYAWGYVKGQDMDQGNNTAASGVGEINAASGATVWEDYQVGEWRGGTASSTIYSNKGSWKFFPFQSYSVQNIEAPVNYAYGSNLKCFWTIFGNGSVYDVKFPLIASSGSLFQLKSGGTVRKWYDPTTDHVCFEMGGTAALDALTLTVMGESVSSSDYYLPIPANLKISLKSGNTLTVSKPMTMHAGSVVEVQSGARLNVNSKVFLYDADDWDTYCMYAYYYRTYYSPSLHFNRGDGTAKTNLEDATVIVDGTVSVGAQNLYATAHGANICGNGGGTFIYNTLPSNTTMTQCKVLKDNVSVNIRSANLHNDNGTYTKGIASTTFKNVNGRWFTSTKATEKANHTYDFTYIKSGDVYGTGGTNGTVAACWSKDKTGLELQNKWANIKAQGCTNWWEGIDDSHLYNWSRNSAWHQYIKAGSTTTGTGEEAVTTDTYAGSDGKMLYKTDCEFVDAGTIDGNCLYPSNKALVNGSLIAVTANTSPDHGYHKSDAASTYYLCFEGCVWHPATRNAENLYTVDGTKYIWFGDKWMAVEYDSGVSLYYSLSATNVKIYYEYVGSAWVLATPVAEVVTSAGTEQVFSLANAITKAKAGGTNVTIRLLKNISGTISYDGTNNCGLDLNGFTLLSSTSGMITVNSATATFIIKDQSAAGTGKVQLSYSANARRYAISVTKGHLVVNSGTISAINTSAYASGNTTVDVGAITVANGHKVTVNGGSIEAISDHNPYGIYLAGATAMATINGGTIEAKTTERSSSVDSPYGIIGAGSIYVNGGTVKATCYRSSSSRGISSSGTFSMTGGSVIATASSTCYGVYAASGSNTTISGGTITSTTTGATSRALYTVATATINGGTLTATAGSSDAKGIYVANGTTTVNAGAEVNATATTKAYGIYYADNTPTVTVNGGAFTVSTTSTTEAYGVYAAKGTGTINDGTFTVTAKTTGAEGMHVETTNTPKLTVNGGMFMVKNNDGAANGTINNTLAAAANFSLAGGYYNLAPAGSYVAAGKDVYDVERAKEQAIYDAGYVKKVRGNEYTVSWYNYNGTTLLGTTQVESGKVPVWTGETPTYNTSSTTREFDGWSTEAKNAGDTYLNGAALPAVGAADVSYYAHYKSIYAEVTIGSTTTRYTSISSAWSAAMAAKQAYIKVLTSTVKTNQLVFNPSNANSVITLDLNGHYWGMNGSKGADKDCFIQVNKADSKLIITDNSASGNGYIYAGWAKESNLYCLKVSAGECILQGGAIKCDNTTAGNNSIGVSVSGGAVFTMTGGTVDATKTGDAATGTASGIYAYGTANVAGGRVYAHYTNNQAIGVYNFNTTGTVNVSEDAEITAEGKSSAYGFYGYGTVNVEGGTINVTATNGTARGVYITSSSSYKGTATVTGNPTFTITAPSEAYGIYSYTSGVTSTVSGGTFTITAQTGNNAVGAYANNYGEIIIEGGTFTMTCTAGSTAVGAYGYNNGTVTVKGGTFTSETSNSAKEACYGAFANTGTVNVEGGTFYVNPAKVDGNNDCARCNIGASVLNISGGTFTSTNCRNCVRSFGGETTITGNPVFTARAGIDAGTWASATGVAKITVDGGTFNCTNGKAIMSGTHHNVKDTDPDPAKNYDYTVTGDVLILDGKFHTKDASTRPVNTGSGTSYLTIKGGYFTSYTSSNVSELNTYVDVASGCTTTALESTDPMYAADYRYRVNTKFTVTWKDMAGNTLKTDYWNRNDVPSYGSDYLPSDGNTYTFTGWSPTPGPIQSDQVYTAQYTKWEAEVYEGENPTPTRFQYFTDAFREAQELPVAKIKVISDVYYGTSLTLNPTEAAGSKPLTIDLNNHIVNYTPKTATYALTINKAGCKLIIDDSSVAKGGQFGHRQEANNGATISAIYIQNGELELAGGTIIAQNNNTDASTDNSKGTRAVVGNSGTVFTMTGGKLYAKSRFDARAFNSDGNCTFNATGGTIEATTEYATSTWGNNAYGVVLWNYGTFNMSGTATMTVTAASGALGVYPYGGGGSGYPVANISGGSINCLTKTGGGARPINLYGSHSKATISGGDITSNGPAGQWNIECVYCDANATADITGGNFHSTDGGGYCTGVRVFAGTVNISGNPYFDSRHGVIVGDYATTTADATAYVNGGTFNCPQYVFYATSNTRDGVGTVTGRIYVNGGYFKTASGNNICYTGSGTSNLILNGGYYNETSGTTQKTNITTYKGATTEVSTLSPAITVDGRTYHYQLLTDFDITWLGGDSYSKVTTVKSGTMPTNTDLDGKCFLRNDSAFYFTGWSPTPIGVTGDATYNAEGVYHEASVKVGSAAPIIYDDFDEAWAYAMEQASATITLLTNLTRTSSIVYNPAPANARHTFDLNNFTIKENTTDRLLIVNKADAKLTITDNSSAKGGCLYKKRSCDTHMYVCAIYHGELIMAGGKLYVENTKDDKVWHPAICVNTSRVADAIFTMTGGTVESQAKYLAYPIYNYGVANISGGTIVANATTQGSALGFYAVAGTATISGGTFNVTANTNAIGVIVTGWLNNDGSITENGVLNITGGTFNVSPTINNAHAVQSTGTGKKISSTVYTAHGILNVSGGTFNVSCSGASATQVFAAQCNGWRIFDDALPHTLLGESRGEMNISGGTFTVDSRDNGTWVDNSSNIDLLRCWGTLNVTGGNFTIYQYKNPTAVGVYRGKATISGNPVFNVYSHTANATGVQTGGWTHENYCDKNVANNLAEAEINGGTFNIFTEGNNTNCVLANGQISAETKTDDVITAHAGYAMNAKITVNGGTFLGVCPVAANKYPILLNSADDRVGTYGTAKSEIYVTGGRFKSHQGTEASHSATGAVNCHVTGTIELAGGYYETNGQLAKRKADTCVVTNITSAAIDPEYNNGYRYRIDVHYVAQVTAAGVDRKFATFRGAFDYANTLTNSKITLLDNINYEGLNFRYEPATATTCTLDLNGFTFKGAVSGHTGSGEYNNDRLLVLNKANATFIIKDSSVGKTGKFSHEKSGAGYAVIAYHGTLKLESGTVHCKNTSGSAQALRSTDADAYITVTGGKAHAEATTTAYGLNSYNTATVSGGLILAESSAGEAWGVNAQDANGNISIQGNAVVKAIAYTTANGLRAAGGGQVTIKENACDTAISSTVGARGAYTDNGQIFVQGNANIVADAQTIAYGVYLYSANATATIAGGTITPKTHSVGDYASISVYPNSGASVTITGGTFYAQTTGGTSNVSPTRTGINSTLTIDGGTFDCVAAQAVNIRGGLTTINGGTFTAATGIRAMDWADATTITGTCVVNGGTFTTTGVTIYVSSKNNNSRNAHSDVLINGGKFKSTGTKIVQMDATPDGATASTLKIAGGYFNEKSGTTFKEQIEPYIADTSRINTLDPLYEGIYKYEVAPHYVASVKVNSTTTNYTILKNALDYARTQAASLVTILDDCDFETDGQYGYGLGTTGKTMTIDLNNHTVNATNSVTSYDRVFAVTGQITITDNSDAKGGGLNLTKAHNGTFLGVVFNDASQLTLANGTIYVENETASKAVEALNIWGTTGTFRQTGGTLQAKAISATATGVQMRGTAQISGGNITVTSEGGNARAFSQDADAGNSKYSSLTVSGTPTITVSGAGEVSGVYSNVAGTSTTISGGTWNITSTSTSAYGVRLTKANTATISGGTFNATATTTNAYGVYVSAGGSATVSGGTFTSRTGANKNECFGAYATGTGTTLNITGGTFDVNSADKAGGNINVVRVQPSATVTISGGTFRSGANSGYGLVAFGGVTTVSGTALFEAYTGAYVGSWYSGDGSSNVTATVNLNGGTFNVKGVAINVTWNTRYKDGVYLDSPFVNSIVNVNGGRYKTTGGTIVSKKADGADGGTAVLNIAGGYFNEKSGTTFKDQIATYVADTSEINTLDPLLDGIYKYEVAPHYVAKVQTGSTTKYHTTAKAAFDYAKTVANPTITLLDNCTLTDANYTINPGNWTGTLDLNNFTLTPTVDGSLGRAFTIGGTGTKLIVTDNSVGQGGQIYYKGNSSVTIIYFVMGANTEMELAGGTLYVENTNASKKAVGFVVDASTARFTQSSGTFTIKGAYGANGYYGGGTATFTGGTMNVDGGSHQAIGLFPQVSTSVLNVSGTFALNVTSSLADSYGVLVKNSGATGTISGGKFNFNQNTMVGAQLDGSLTINGGYFCEHPSQAGRYKSQINALKGSGKVIMDLDAADAEYIAGYRYLVTDDPVAKVKAGSEVTYYTSVADAIAAANTKTNPTVTMLKNASTTQQTITAAMTLDLNGKTVTSTQASSKKGVFSINASGQTVTITDSGTGGKIDHTASYAGYVYGVALAAGTLNVTGGTIYAKNTHTKDTTTYRAYGIYTAASTTLTISDGTIEAECPNNSYALGISATGNLTMTGGTVRASATTVAYGVYANNTSTELSNVTITTHAEGATSDAIYIRSGHLTVHSGTYTSTGTSSAYAIYAYKVATTIVEVEGGKFSGTTRELYKGTNSTVSISGGYYVHNTTVKDNCASNHHVLPASLTEDEITYNYKVAEAYTLTWNLDGGTVTTAGTGAAVDAAGTPSIVWGVGDAITAPVVTKTGYTFAAWTPAVAATMPAANTTYNATWTINSFDVTFNMQGHGSAIAKQTINYNGLVTEPATPTEANYVFGGWYKEAGCTNAWNFATDHVTAATTLYAKWTAAVASVQVGVGTPEYFATVADAISDANGKSNPTVTMLQDAPTEEVTITAAMTINLNGKTVSSTETTAAKAVFKISTTATATTVTIRDGASGGKIDHTAAVEGKLYGIYVTKGTLSMTGGTVYVKNNVATNNSNYRTYAIASGDANGIINISGGTVEAYSPKTVRPLGVCANGNLTITGGTIIADGLYYARGIYANGTTTSLSNVTVTASATHSTGASNYAVQVNAGTATIHSGTYSASSTGTGACYAVYESGGTVNINDGKFSGKSQDFKKASGTTSIIGGYFVHDTDIQTNCATNYHVLPASLTEGGITYNYKVAEAYNLTWATDGDELTGDYTSGYTEPGTTIVQPNTPTKTGYTFAAWTPAVAATMPAANTTYTAQWAVASVTISGVTTPYATMTDAWKAVNSATAASTLTMLQDISITGQMQYKNTQNCTLDLNGHTITSTTNVKSPLHVYDACTFTITDGSVDKSGKLSMTTTYSSNIIFGACAEKGNLVLEAGTIEVISGSQNTCGVTVFTPNSFTMNGGTIHVVTSNSKEGRGLYFNGSVTINDGTIHVEAAGDGYAMKRDGGTITVNGGKFNINGATTNINHTGSASGGVTIHGGWYNTNNRLDAFVTSPYYVLNLSSSDPLYAEGYRFVVAEVANTGFYADIVDVDNTNSKLILNVTGWASGGWPYTINGVEYQKTAREADRTLKVPYTGVPGDDFAMLIQKTGGDFVSSHIYVIPQEIASNTTITANQTKSLYVKNGATLTVNGSITVKNIYVGPDATLTINSDKTLTADSIFLRTTASSAAQMENKGTIAGSTKVVYTRIIKDKDFHFFGLPLSCAISAVKLSDGVVPQYGSGWLLRSYSESRRATTGADDNNWVSEAEGATIAGGKGYEMYSASNYYREFYFPVDLDDLTNQVPVTYHLDAAGAQNAGWNALVSPFTHAYENAKEPENLVVNWYQDGYGYYEQEIPSVIPPAKPFAFQATKNGYLSFEGASIVAKMPRRAAEEEVQIQWINLDITDANGVGDQTSIYSHPTRYDAAYQTGIDVAKQSLTAARAILYSSHAYGEMAFAGVADSVLESGVALTIYSPKEQELTFSMRDNDWLNRMEYVWLIDHETGAATDLLYDTYTFSAPAGTTRGRFTIQGVFKAPQITTDLEPTSDSSLKGREARKVLIDQKMYILLDGAMYDATGKRVNK